MQGRRGYGPYSMAIQRSGSRRSFGVAQLQVRYDFKLLNIQVWLIEAVEEYQAIRACFNQSFAKCGRAVKYGLSFTARGM